MNQTSTTPATPSANANFVRRLYNWMLHWADTPYGLTALAILSFAESSVFPIPPDILLIALVLGAPTKWWRIAAVCTIASVVGGLFGYGIGMFFWQSVGTWIVENIAHMELVAVDGRMDIALPAYLVDNFANELGGAYLFQVYDAWNAWIVFVFGLTPLPYKLITVTAGVAQVNVGIFILASIASRALRFFAVAYILKLIGEPAKEFIEKHFNLLTIAFVVLLVGGFAAIKLLL